MESLGQGVKPLPHSLSMLIAQMQDLGDAPTQHNLPDKATLSTNDDLQIHPEEIRKLRLKRRVHKDQPLGGQPAGLSQENPYYSVDQNNGDKSNIEYDSRIQDPQNWDGRQPPTDKHWNQGYAMQTTYAIKHLIAISDAEDAMVADAAVEGKPVSEGEPKSVTIPVTHVYEDITAICKFVNDDLEALESAGEDVAEAKKHLEAIKAQFSKKS